MNKTQVQNSNNKKKLTNQNNAEINNRWLWWLIKAQQCTKKDKGHGNLVERMKAVGDSMRRGGAVRLSVTWCQLS